VTVTETVTVGEHDSVTVCGRNYLIQSPWPTENSKERKEERAERN
jgi:hypothetical protein